MRLASIPRSRTATVMVAASLTVLTAPTPNASAGNRTAPLHRLSADDPVAACASHAGPGQSAPDSTESPLVAANPHDPRQSVVTWAQDSWSAPGGAPRPRRPASPAAGRHDHAAHVHVAGDVPLRRPEPSAGAASGSRLRLAPGAVRRRALHRRLRRLGAGRAAERAAGVRRDAERSGASFGGVHRGRGAVIRRGNRPSASLAHPVAACNDLSSLRAVTAMQRPDPARRALAAAATSSCVPPSP